MMKEVSVHPFRLLYIVALLSLLFASNPLHASVGDVWKTADSNGNTRVNVYFFWSPLCPHCTDARGYLNSLPESYPWINLQSYNVVDLSLIHI